MQRFIRGMVLAGVAGLVWGCDDDPLSDGAGDDLHLVGYPSSLFVGSGDTKPMEFELLDANGAANRTEFTISNVSAGITAVIDETFLPDYDPEGVLGPPDQPARIRVNVTGGATPSVNSFDVTAGGVTETYSVRVTPTEIPATFSTLTPGLGEVVTATASPGVLFTGDTEVTFGEGIPNGVVTGVAGDGSTIDFIMVPGVVGTPTFTDVAVSYDPDLTFTVPATSELAAAPPPAAVPAVYSSTTPDAGEEVTVTAAGFQFPPTIVVDFGNVAAGNVSVAGDGSSLTFIPVPGSTGIPTFHGIEIAGLPGIALSLPGDAPLTVGTTVAAAIPGTDDPGTAPAFDLPTVAGLSTVVTDQFNVVDQFYNFNVVADAHYTVVLWWEGGGGCANDVDLLTSEGNAFTCDNPEVLPEIGPLTAGEVLETLAEIFDVVSNPDWVQLIVTKVD